MFASISFVFSLERPEERVGQRIVQLRKRGLHDELAEPVIRHRQRLGLLVRGEPHQLQDLGALPALQRTHALPKRVVLNVDRPKLLLRGHAQQVLAVRAQRLEAGLRPIARVGLLDLDQNVPNFRLGLHGLHAEDGVLLPLFPLAVLLGVRRGLPRARLGLDPQPAPPLGLVPRDLLHNLLLRPLGLVLFSFSEVHHALPLLVLQHFLLREHLLAEPDPLLFSLPI
mmetsp:Transcript_5142/g.18553  ORF Transcript_5142/g.18553 Transcript_5142/m.18553 type:complete len:226 (+) Transcript_5142:297-974(+)